MSEERVKRKGERNRKLDGEETEGKDEGVNKQLVSEETVSR